MTIGEYIKSHAKEEGRSLLWIAGAMDMNYKTFMGKLTRNTLSAEELLKVSDILDINLEHMKYEVNYGERRAFEYIYVAENISYEDVMTRERILATPMEVKEGNHKGNLPCSSVYAFIEIENEDGTINYELREIETSGLKKRRDTVSSIMIRTAEGSQLFIKGKKKIPSGSI